MGSNQFFLESSSIFKALSHPLRLRMLNFISFAPRTVEECAEKFGESVQNVSQHLKQLAKLDVFDIEKVKNYHYYFLKNELMTELISSAAKVSGLYSVDLNSRWQGSISEASALIKNKSRLIWDLREDAEKSYLPIPAKYLLEKPEGPCFVVCRGPWCEMLSKEVRRLKGSGSDVVSLSYTFDELKQLISYLF